MYALRDAKIWYGARSIPMQNVELPESIESADDLDLHEIAEQLNRYVYNRGNNKYRPGYSAKERWKLEFEGTSPEKAAELNEELSKDESLAHLNLPPFKPTIIVSGEGISIIYEGE